MELRDLISTMNHKRCQLGWQIVITLSAEVHDTNPVNVAIVRALRRILGLHALCIRRGIPYKWISGFEHLDFFSTYSDAGKGERKNEDELEQQF